MKALTCSFLSFMLSFIIINEIKSKIIPDPQNGFLINRPTISMKGQILNFNFKITSKIFNFQYFAIVFPTNLKLDTAPNFSCSLYDPKNKISITLLPKQSPDGEGTTAYCQINDINSPILDSTITYQFSLILNEINLGGNYLTKIGMFTATEISKEKMILDINFFYSEFAVFNDYKTFTNSPIFIMESKTSVTPLYLFTTFDLIVTFSVSNFISQKSIILFKFPSQYVSEPYSCYSDKVAETDMMKSALKGDINCKLFGDSKDTLILSGLQEDLPQLRTFKMVFRGFNTLNSKNSDLNNYNLFETFILYPNSYSILGYANKATFIVDTVKVNPFTIEQVEGQELHRGGAWPLKFTFSLDSSIPIPSYVVIQHQDASETNKANFIASTCDFSANPGVISNYFGERPKCVPLSLDKYNYSKKGNGIFFKINSILGKKIYTVVVFVYPESCGNYSFTKAVLPNISSVIFNFTLTIFSDVDPKLINENKIFFSTNKILSVSEKTPMKTECYNSLKMNQNFNEAKMDEIYEVIGDTNITTAVEKLIYNEVYDYKLGNYKNVCDTDTTCYFYDLTSKNTFNEGFIYSKDSTKTLNSSYFSMRALIPSPDKKLPFSRTLIAVNLLKGTNPDPNNFASTTMVYSFSKNFLQKGDNLCTIWWGSRFEKLDRTKNPFDFSFDSTNPTLTGLVKQNILGKFEGVQNSYVNYITETGVTPTIDVSSDRFLATENSIKIMSRALTDEFKVFNNVASEITGCSIESCNVLNFSVFTNCIKWATEIPPPVSQYTYFDMVLKFKNQNNNIFSRVNRFFKFIGNTGLTDYTTTNNDIFNTFDKTKIKFFYSFFEGNNYDNGICLIQINKDELIKISKNDSNILRINFIGLTLFDTDYTDLAASYPVYTGNNENDSISLNSRDFISDFSIKKQFGEIFSDSSNANTLNQYIDNYYNYLGAGLIINNFQKFNLKSDLIIPTFCPTSNDFGITISFQTSYINKNTGYYERYNSIAMEEVDCTSLGSGCKRYKTLFTNSITKAAETNNNSKAKIYFEPYSLTSTSTSDNMKMHFMNIYETPIICSGMSILLEPSIKLIDNDPLDSTNSIKLNLDTKTFNSLFLKMNSKFHAFNRTFDKVIFGIFDSEKTFPILKNDDVLGKENLKTYYVYGVYRPTLDEFTEYDSKGNLVIIGKIAFSCVCNNVSNTINFSNINRTYPSGKNNKNSLPDTITLDFDFVKDVSTEWPQFSYTYDANYPLFDKDKGGSIILSIQTPIKIYTNMQIYFENEMLTDNSICSIKSKNYNNSSNNKYCSFVISGSQSYSFRMACDIRYPDDTFDIACYNLNISNYKSDPDVKITDKYFYNKENQIRLKDSTNKIIFRKFTDFTIVIPNFDPLININIIIPDQPIHISEIKYAYAAQEGAIGKVFFSLTLPRKILRNSYVSFIADISGFMIKKNSGIMPTCKIAGSNLYNNNSPEAILKTCEIIPVAPEDVLKTKIIFKFYSENYIQNIEYVQNIEFYLFPVLTQFINLENPFDFYFKYNFMKSNELIYSPNVNLKSKIKSFDSVNYFKEFSAIYQDSKLCDITGAIPGIINEYNKITISLDFQTNYFSAIDKNKDKYKVNEFIFFFPSNNIEILENFDCSPKSSILYRKYLKCSVIEDVDLPAYKILNVILADDIFFPQGIFDIYISGIKINTPAYINAFPNVNNINQNTIPNTFDFICSFNYFNLQNKKRVTLINGNGKLAYNFNLPKILGTLNIDALSTTTNMPRKMSTISLKINFELLNGLTAKPVNFDGSPYFIVQFPKEIIFKYFRALSLTCTILELTGVDSQQSLTQTVIPTKPCEIISDNIVKIPYNSTLRNFTTNLRFFLINFNGTYNPGEELDSIGQFKVILTNENNNYIYKNYFNLNYLNYKKLTYTNGLDYNFIDSTINSYRGLSYTYDPSLWIIDAYNTENDILKDSKNTNMKNKINVKLGRFTSITLRTRINNGIPNAQTSLFFNEDQFAFLNSTKPFLTSTGSMELMIGSSCNTLPGTYYSTIFYNNTNNFNSFTPLELRVELTKAYIKLDIPKTAIIKGSVLKIPVYVMEPNYEELEIKFFPDKTNDIASKINALTVNRYSNYYETNFQSSFSAVDGNQGFSPQILNNCFMMSPEFQKFSIKITSNKSVLDNMFKIEDNLYYVNFNTEKTINRNSVRVIFLPPVSYGFISCVSLCYNSAYPEDSSLMSENFSDFPLMFLYTRTFSNSNLDPQNFNFENLIRGERYKLKCVFQFTTIQNTLTRFSLIEKLKYYSNQIPVVKSNNTIPINYLETEKSTPTRCVQFYFLNKIDSLAQTSFVDYCQSLLKDVSGCPVCVDSFGNINESANLSSKRSCGNKGENVFNGKLNNLDIIKTGLSTPLYFSRENVGKINQKLMNKSIKINNIDIPIFMPSNSPYLLCVVQDKTCPNNIDPDVFSMVLNKLQYTLSSTEKIKQNIGISSISYLNSLIITDSTPNIGNLKDFIVNGPNLDTKDNIYILIYFNLPLLCHWKIQLSSDLVPSVYEIEKCFDEKFCGSSKINMIPSYLIFTSKGNINVKQIYSIFMVCYNDLPYPVSNSEVIMLTEIKQLSGIFKYDDIPLINPNSTIQNGTNGNSTNSANANNGTATNPAGLTNSTNTTGTKTY